MAAGTGSQKWWGWGWGWGWVRREKERGAKRELARSRHRSGAPSWGQDGSAVGGVSRDLASLWRLLVRGWWTAAVFGAVAACAPPPLALPLAGLPAPARILPLATLPRDHHVIRFKWRYQELAFSANGDGAARIAYPDSARFDFVAGGSTGGGGRALLFDSTLVAPGAGGIDRYLPAIPLLWAALGRLAVPSAADTVVRVEGDTIRADIGPTGAENAKNVTVWRVEFVSGELVSLARLRGGRVRETVRRNGGAGAGVDGAGDAGGSVRYEQFESRRSLTLTQVRSEAVPEFDPTIRTW